MSDPENFLTRWSRRKRADEADRSSRDEVARDVGAVPATVPNIDPAAMPAAGMPAENSTPAEPVFDLAKLPSIESIAADTDVRAFLAPGVPAELRHAALRRAWAADPKVRDYVGFADYDWDFNTPGALEGFGPLEMTDELRREVLRIVGGLQAEAEPPPAVATTPEPEVLPSPAVAAANAPLEPAAPANQISEKPMTDPDDAAMSAMTLHRNNKNVATQENAAPSDARLVPARRGHGGALPS